jgi:ADP-ribose pyrophosphatase YjhB (NUDIX family)
MIERFCSACGARLAGRPPTVCPACGAEHWDNAKPCANALVVERGDVLLVRRAHDPWRGGWCAPGGFCEPGEHPIAAAEREILEEAGIRARVVGFLGIWLDTYSDDPDDPDADTISVAYYLAERADAAPPVAYDEAETAEVGWFPLDALPSPLMPPGTFDQAVAAAGAAIAAGTAITALPDAPSGARQGQSER